VGSVSGSPTFGGKTMTVNLTGVTNQQQITVKLSGVTDAIAQVLPDTSVSMGVLLADTTGDGSVNSADISQTKSRSGQPVDPTNFRSDVTVDGSVNSADISLVKSKSGTALP
jgi:Dockerin type I domain